MWDDWHGGLPGSDQPQSDQESFINFDFFSASTKPKDYYKTLEVDYDATDDDIRANYIRLALKWHPDKQKDQDIATSRFQEINEAYQVLSDPIKRREYDIKGMLYKYDYNVVEYLNRFKGLILTCNGLGIKHSIWNIRPIIHQSADMTIQVAHSPAIAFQTFLGPIFSIVLIFV